MMKKFLLLIPIFIACSFSEKEIKPKKLVDAYFACSISKVTSLDVTTFTNLLNQSLCAKDSNQTTYKVDGFTITYAERGLFQDSTGLPIIHTDYTVDNCKGDSIPTRWKLIFKDRAYKGDTVMIDNVAVRDSSNRYLNCKGVKIVLK